MASRLVHFEAAIGMVLDNTVKVLNLCNHV